MLGILLYAMRNLHQDNFLMATAIAGLLLGYTLLAIELAYPDIKSPTIDPTVQTAQTACYAKEGNIQRAVEDCGYTRDDVIRHCVLADAAAHNQSAIDYLVGHFGLTPHEVYATDGCWPIFDAAIWRRPESAMRILQQFKTPSPEPGIVRDAVMAFDVFCVRDDVDTAVWFMRMRGLSDDDIARCARLSPLHGKVAAWAARFLAAAV